MKRLAIPLIDGQLSEHFGHADEFAFFEIENSKIIKSYRKTPPPHAEGTIPNFLGAEKATDILVGGIGPKAIQILNQYDINVFVAVEKNTADNLALDFVNDDLKYGQNYCTH